MSPDVYAQWLYLIWKVLLFFSPFHQSQAWSRTKSLCQLVSVGSQSQATQCKLHLVSLHGLIKTRLFKPTKALLSRFLIWIDLNFTVSSGWGPIISTQPSFTWVFLFFGKKNGTYQYHILNSRSRLTRFRHSTESLKKYYQLQCPFKIHPCESNWVHFIAFQKGFGVSFGVAEGVEAESPQPFSQLNLSFQNFLFLAPGVMSTLSTSPLGSAITTLSRLDAGVFTALQSKRVPEGPRKGLWFL